MPAPGPAAFLVATSFRVPGLGLLVQASPPAPAWLAAHSLRTALALRLHRPGWPALSVGATIEELTRDGQPAARALLLDADPEGPMPANAWLEFAAIIPENLLGLH